MGAARLRLTPFGDDAVLIETPDPVGLAAAARRLAGVTDAIPGDGCVVVRGLASLELSALTGSSVEPSRLHVLPTVYDGMDLPELPPDTVARHSAATYTVAFLGFSPGFAYLDGLDPLLSVPRLDTPRVAVPAGAVGIAGSRCCIYPTGSPGGWKLVGRVVDAVLFDAWADPPALLAPGDQVRFQPC